MLIVKTDNKEQRIQYILDENGVLQEMPRADAVPVEHPIRYKLKNAFEVFVLVKDTENYWISNYGRCVNNLNHKDKTTFYEHKQGNVHYTVYEIERAEIPVKYKRKLTGKVKIEETRHKVDTSPERLAAQTFLKPYRGRGKIWHKDGDFSNNWYKNLLYVTREDYKKLKAGTLLWDELDYGQEYTEYENKASHQAMHIYNSIKIRCGDTRDCDNIGRCYDDAAMCDLWLNFPRLFVKWYLEHYYEIEGESMAVDKDLFGGGSKMYSPENCCILPQGLNTLLTNCKKHYSQGETKESVLPLGVRYNNRTKKYYGEIRFTGNDRVIQLSEWDTEEEAFAEYRIMKQADILMVAAQYKEHIPDYIYNALLKVEVEPY